MHRRPSHIVPLLVAGTLAAILLVPAAASATDSSPCRAYGKVALPRSKGGPTKQVTIFNCPLTQAKVPVRASRDQNSRIVGFKTNGRGFFFQHRGRPNRFKGNSNVYWAYARTDNGKHGWVGEVLFRGGANLEPDAGLPQRPIHTIRRRSCSNLREGQRRLVNVNFRYRDINSYVRQDGYHRQKVLRSLIRRFATIRIRGATCKVPHGGWRVIDPVGVGYQSVGLSSTGEIRSEGVRRGWALGLRSGRGGSRPRMSFQVMHCGKGAFFGTIKELASIPIPDLPFKASVALYLTKFLPDDKVKCANVGTLDMRVGADRRGRLTVKAADRTVAETKTNHDRNSDLTNIRSYVIQRLDVSRR